MHILILGAAGMIGRKLTERLLQDGRLGQRAIARMTLHDVVPAQSASAPFPVNVATGDFVGAEAASAFVAERPDVIFHLAAVVSGEAEANFEKGYRINLDGTRYLLEAIRAIGGDYRPRLVFASSIAAYGAPFPSAISDEYLSAPLTSYGTQKVICELLLADYTRRGFLDGIGIRLPTICVRPGQPNKAASGFFSNIIREPLAGQPAVLPVAESVRHWHASPRSAIGFLVHAATLDSELIGPRRTLNMPGLSATVADQISALTAVAGPAVAGRIRREPDNAIASIINGWPQSFETRRAVGLGFVAAEKTFEDIIRIHIEDECGGSFVR